MIFKFDPGGIILVSICFLAPTNLSKRLKRELEHLDIDIDHRPDNEFISTVGIDFNSTSDEYSRAFIHVRHMLVSIACYEYAKTSTRNCPYNQMRYFKTELATSYDPRKFDNYKNDHCNQFKVIDHRDLLNRVPRSVSKP